MRKVLRVTGDDRVEFLQGLVTNDVNRAPVWAALLTARCWSSSAVTCPAPPCQPRTWARSGSSVTDRSVTSSTGLALWRY